MTPLLTSGSSGPGGRPPLRIVVAAVITVVLVAVWGIGALVRDDGDGGTARAPGSTTTSAPVVTTTTAPPLVEVQADWPRKGVSRFGESEDSKQLRESLPPTTTSTSTTLPERSTTSLARRRR